MNKIRILSNIKDLCGFVANVIYQLLATDSTHEVQKVKRKENRMGTLLSLVLLL